jgi:hypothetical protein
MKPKTDASLTSLTPERPMLVRFPASYAPRTHTHNSCVIIEPELPSSWLLELN